ncbi:enoyl-CoA hydratase/isomerase family protein [Antricoccus suffuscus]|uniref:enoyl-CoA hydratase/isomerase family protein n=1 Tax=Antricoccus suffuscus TaxID=1629062 RepID=UPI0014761D5B|nr:enoyl-CoA hydratase/isomerase family protein [Antricoccus suffuscus]
MSLDPPVLIDRVSSDRRDLVLNRGATRNALSGALVDGLLIALHEAEIDGVRLVVLRSCTRVFSSGFDLGSLEHENDASLLLRFARIGLLLEQISRAPFFTVAVMEGAAVGAGADVALACDHRIGTPHASFRFPGAGFGVVLGTLRLTGLVGESEALRLVSTNATLPCAEAAGLGVVRMVPNNSDIEALVTELQTGIEALSADTARDLCEAARHLDYARALADLVRSIAGRPGIKDRIAAFAASARPQPPKPDDVPTAPKPTF